jgi:hypothetical protein
MLNEARGSVTRWKAHNDHLKKKKTKVIFPISYPTSSKLTQPIMTNFIIYTPQNTCQYACENQIENVISHAAKESNKI